MTEVLIDVLCTEIDSFNNSGNQNLESLYSESAGFLSDLKLLEASLENQLEQGSAAKPKEVDKLAKQLNNWYKTSINDLKLYNSSINKFFKNILNSPKFNIDLDDAYTYPLNLYNHPHPGDVQSHDELTVIKSDNRRQLIKAIIIHLLKVGQCDTVTELIKEIPNVVADENLLVKFQELNSIIDDIVVRHDLKSALNWLELKYNENVAGNFMNQAGSQSGSSPEKYKQIEFKFTMLQLILMLNTSGEFSLDDSLAAFLYSKEKFQKFFMDYLQEISTLMLLLVYENEQGLKRGIKNIIIKIKQGYELDKNKSIKHKQESQFISELLTSFDDIHTNQTIFINLASEFISEYCKDLHLSKDSSLFQSVLAGFVYLPSFYKYNRIQMKMNNVKTEVNDEPEMVINHEATYHYDLPFQLPDSPRFLFRYHPIFICPVSKEQLIPMNNTNYGMINESGTDEQKIKRIRTGEMEHIHPNPIVVLNFCHHLALLESVYQLSKKGTDFFKCHYCYKKHKFSDVTNAYIIDF